MRRKQQKPTLSTILSVKIKTVLGQNSCRQLLSMRRQLIIPREQTYTTERDGGEQSEPVNIIQTNQSNVLFPGKQLIGTRQSNYWRPRSTFSLERAGFPKLEISCFCTWKPYQALWYMEAEWKCHSISPVALRWVAETVVYALVSCLTLGLDNTRKKHPRQWTNWEA